MTKEEFDKLKPGDKCIIARNPHNGDNIPGIGHEFEISYKSGSDYLYPVVSGFGGCWHYDYCDLVKKKDGINQYQIY